MTQVDADAMASTTTQDDAPPQVAGETTASPVAPEQAGTTAGAHSEHCVSDRPSPAGQASSGEIIQINEIDVYISKPADYPHAPAKFLLLLTGGTGLKSVNNQLQADKFAAEGFLVAMPDLFGGDAAPGSHFDPDVAEDNTGSFLDTFKLKIAETAKSFQIDMWLARHTEEKVLPILRKVIDGCRDEFADAIAAGDGIYAVGYCIGGRYILLLGSERPSSYSGDADGQQAKPADEESGRTTEGPLIKVGALAHGASVQPSDFKDVKIPVSMVCVEDDPLFPDDIRKTGEDAMSKANLEHEVRVYPGVPHGFAVVGEYEDAAIREAQATAHKQMLTWIMEH